MDKIANQRLTLPFGATSSMKGAESVIMDASPVDAEVYFSSSHILKHWPIHLVPMFGDDVPSRSLLD